MHTTGRKDLSGFTLIELLVVIGITGVLVALALPAVQSVRDSARRTECTNNLRQVALSIQSFTASHRHFPSGINSPDHIEFPSLTWLGQTLPFVEQSSLWAHTKKEFATGASPFSPHLGMQTIVPTFQCPSSYGINEPQFTNEGRLVALTCYIGVNGTDYTERDGIFFMNSRVRHSDVTDGLSNTLMIGERPPSADFWYGWWYAGFGQEASGSPDMLLGAREINNGARYAEHCPMGPYHFQPGKETNQCDVFHFWSLHSGGANFSFADGSIRFVAYVSDDILPDLSTRSGDEIVDTTGL